MRGSVRHRARLIDLPCKFHYCPVRRCRSGQFRFKEWLCRSTDQRAKRVAPLRRHNADSPPLLCGVHMSSVPKTHASYLREVSDKSGGDVVVLGTYVGAHIKLSHLCSCGTVFTRSPANMLSPRKSHLCPACVYTDRGVRHRRDPETYAHRFRLKHPTLTLIVPYTKQQQHIVYKCTKCGGEAAVLPNNALKSMGCLYCASVFKDYQLGDRWVRVQGYEPYALDYLLQKGVPPDRIKVHSEDYIPEIEYRFMGKDRRHHPDFYIPYSNILVEVKSTLTSGLRGRYNAEGMWGELCKKAITAISIYGIDYRLLLMLDNGSRLSLPRNWYSYTLADIRREARYA